MSPLASFRRAQSGDGFLQNQMASPAVQVAVYVQQSTSARKGLSELQGGRPRGSPLDNRENSERLWHPECSIRANPQKSAYSYNRKIGRRDTGQRV